MTKLITKNSACLMLPRVAGVTLILAAAIAAVAMNGTAAGGVSGTSIRPSTSDPLVSVNRVNKGDRLPHTAVEQQSSHSSPSTEAVVPPKHVPLGCDPAFSPVADPARGNIYKRCLV